MPPSSPGVTTARSLEQQRQQRESWQGEGRRVEGDESYGDGGDDRGGGAGGGCLSPPSASSLSALQRLVEAQEEALARMASLPQSNTRAVGLPPSSGRAVQQPQRLNMVVLSRQQQQKQQQQQQQQQQLTATKKHGDDENDNEPSTAPQPPPPPSPTQGAFSVKRTPQHYRLRTLALAFGFLALVLVGGNGDARGAGSVGVCVLPLAGTEVGGAVSKPHSKPPPRACERGAGGAFAVQGSAAGESELAAAPAEEKTVAAKGEGNGEEEEEEECAMADAELERLVLVPHCGADDTGSCDVAKLCAFLEGWEHGDKNKEEGAPPSWSSAASLPSPLP
eukprot:CAMPEP_0171846410 /NCGR_PEP_ID=MMETSP0992-20121227/17706_1 /TAXON_ID=483369 /ORGANISM="non described non described, Strain CCMP2098" /LENGTH=334 /DNA_ID=CAMNT_0012464707 /DNA_START=110 /DNA_END=1114 /DNA_ORIENTATION=+